MYIQNNLNTEPDNQIDLDLYNNDKSILSPSQFFINIGKGKYLHAAFKKRPVLLHKMREHTLTTSYINYKRFRHSSEASYDCISDKSGSPMGFSGVIYSPGQHTWQKNVWWLSGTINASRTFHVCCTLFTKEILYRRCQKELSAFGKELIILLLDDLYIFQPKIIEKTLTRTFYEDKTKYYRLVPNPHPSKIQKRKAITPEALKNINFSSFNPVEFLHEKLMVGALYEVKTLITSYTNHTTLGNEKPLLTNSIKLLFVLYDIYDIIDSHQTTMLKFQAVYKALKDLHSILALENAGYYNLLLEPILAINAIVKIPGFPVKQAY